MPWVEWSRRKTVEGWAPLTSKRGSMSEAPKEEGYFCDSVRLGRCRRETRNFGDNMAGGFWNPLFAQRIVDDHSLKKEDGLLGCTFTCEVSRKAIGRLFSTGVTKRLVEQESMHLFECSLKLGDHNRSMIVLLSFLCPMNTGSCLSSTQPKIQMRGLFRMYRGLLAYVSK